MGEGGKLQEPPSAPSRPPTLRAALPGETKGRNGACGAQRAGGRPPAQEPPWLPPRPRKRFRRPGPALRGRSAQGLKLKSDKRECKRGGTRRKHGATKLEKTKRTGTHHEPRGME